MADPFHVRFKIDVPNEEAQRRFINRIENRVLNLVQALDKAGRTNSVNVINPLIVEVESALGEPHLTHVGSPSVFIEVWRERIKGDFSRCLIAVEKLHEIVSVQFDELGSRKITAVITESLGQSETDLGISWQNGFFSKKGAELLDDELVNEALGWLADPKYRNVLVPFQKGLSHLLEGTRDAQRLGDTVTDMYEALEAMAKIVTGKPTKDLSGLREEFIGKLGLPESHKTMLKAYIEYGCDFRHALDAGQKRTWPLEHEAENFVYLTGIFIRLAIQSEKH